MKSDFIHGLEGSLSGLRGDSDNSLLLGRLSRRAARAASTPKIGFPGGSAT
jgi:hypothetical protein